MNRPRLSVLACIAINLTFNLIRCNCRIPYDGSLSIAPGTGHASKRMGSPRISIAMPPRFSQLRCFSVVEASRLQKSRKSLRDQSRCVAR